jgi:hypothetical protein
MIWPDESAWTARLWAAAVYAAQASLEGEQQADHRQDKHDQLSCLDFAHGLCVTTSN